CREVGVVARLIKPVKQADLWKAVLTALGTAAPESDDDDLVLVPRKKDKRPLRILLAEDNLFNQRLAIGLLSKWGHTVTVAGNGKEALAVLEKQPFDLVLMDVQMPEMDGLEATAAIREKEKSTGQHIPI